MLESCPLFLESVVVLLKYSDELLEVIDLLTVQELDLFSINTVV